MIGLGKICFVKTESQSKKSLRSSEVNNNFTSATWSNLAEKLFMILFTL